MRRQQIKWLDENRDKKNAQQARWYHKNKEEILRKNEKYRLDHLDYYNFKQRERKNLFSVLQNDYSDDDFIEIYETFNFSCSLTNEKDNISVDHFIPISWGHGGTIKSNLLILNTSLNQSKRDVNPFNWIQSLKMKDKYIKEKWDNLVKHLAVENNLSIQDFKKYVYWCENNKRTVEDILLDGNVSSIDLWRNNNLN